mmetsp:Transcript_106604/g.331051  ORF Transcript_106604/g.331051 Transcript_106604/m.331051 type:complete len:357 (+) Transcript_106604:128-1198(+)
MCSSSPRLASAQPRRRGAARGRQAVVGLPAPLRVALAPVQPHARLHRRQAAGQLLRQGCLEEGQREAGDTRRRGAAVDGGGQRSEPAAEPRRGAGRAPELREGRGPEVAHVGVGHPLLHAVVQVQAQLRQPPRRLPPGAAAAPVVLPAEHAIHDVPLVPHHRDVLLEAQLKLRAAVLRGHPPLLRAGRVVAERLEVEAVRVPQAHAGPAGCSLPSGIVLLLVVLRELLHGRGRGLHGLPPLHGLEDAHLLRHRPRLPVEQQRGVARGRRRLLLRRHPQLWDGRRGHLHLVLGTGRHASRRRPLAQARAGLGRLAPGRRPRLQLGPRLRRLLELPGLPLGQGRPAAVPAELLRRQGA